MTVFERPGGSGKWVAKFVRHGKQHSDAERELLRYMEQLVALRKSARSLRVGTAYSCSEDFVLQHGEFWTPQPLPEGRVRMPPKLCFWNARSLQDSDSALRYVEGYAASIFAIHHAWCVDPEGRVIDPTWEEAGSAYLGVALTSDELADVPPGIPALDDWERGWPILQQPRVAA